VQNPTFAVTQLAQTTMRAEIGQMTLDRTLAERARLNSNIVEAINAAAADWGIKCLRYEIRDIHPPEKVVEAMHSQVSAERQKRADILASVRKSNLNARVEILLKAIFSSLPSLQLHSSSSTGRSTSSRNQCRRGSKTSHDSRRRRPNDGTHQLRQG
jgi:hypothetical protein